MREILEASSGPRGGAAIETVPGSRNKRRGEEERRKRSGGGGAAGGEEGGRRKRRGALPIHLASWAGGRRGDEETVRIFRLLHESYPPGMTAEDGDGDTPLIIMVKYGRTAPGALRYVMESNPDGLEGSGSGVGAVRGGRSALHATLSGPGHSDTPAVASMILLLRPDLARFPDPRTGRLPLHLALDQCCVDTSVVVDLLNVHPEASTVRDGGGDLPLHHACREGVEDAEAVMGALLDAHPESPAEADKDGALPLHLSLGARRGRFLDPASSDGDGMITPVDATTLLLLDRYPESSSRTDPRKGGGGGAAGGGMLPLHAAVQNHRPPIVVRRLMEAHPAALTEPVSGDGNGAGGGVLHELAAAREEYDPDVAASVASALLGSHPEGAEMRDGRGRLPLHVVASPTDRRRPGHGRRRGEAVETKKRKKKNGNNNNGGGNSTILMELLRAHPEGARVADWDGYLPLHHACASHDVDAVSALLDAYPGGADVQSATRPENGGEERDDGIPPPSEEGTSASTGGGGVYLPLHLACGASRPRHERLDPGASAAADALIPLLLSASPQSASVPDRHGGDFALNHLTGTEGLSSRLSSGTAVALVSAYPEAATRRDTAGGDLPIHGALRDLLNDGEARDAAASSASAGSGRSSAGGGGLLRALLRAYPRGAVERDGHGNAPLHVALSSARGVGPRSARQLWLARSLLNASSHSDVLSYSSSPGDDGGGKGGGEEGGESGRRMVAAMRDHSDRLPAHLLARLVGEAGGAPAAPAGSSVREKSDEVAAGWIGLFRDVVGYYPDALTEVDRRGSTPLHVLCSSLYDSSSERRGAASSPAIHGLVVELFRYVMTTAPDALTMRDKDNHRPGWYVEDDRRRNAAGRDVGQMSGTLTDVKGEVGRGARYWRGVTEESEGGDEL